MRITCVADGRAENFKFGSQAIVLGFDPMRGRRQGIIPSGKGTYRILDVWSAVTTRSFDCAGRLDD